jgi:hypothetical protein
MVVEIEWDVFRMVKQEGMTPTAVAEKLNCLPSRVFQILNKLQKKHPDLFPPESEAENLCRQLGPQSGRKMLRFEPDMESQVAMEF